MLGEILKKKFFSSGFNFWRAHKNPSHSVQATVGTLLAIPAKANRNTLLQNLSHRVETHITGLLRHVVDCLLFL